MLDASAMHALTADAQELEPSVGMLLRACGIMNHLGLDTQVRGLGCRALETNGVYSSI
eukprot:COSAG02_NODE_5339_length_4421_cov_1.716104_6_plen_58_part_00